VIYYHIVHHDQKRENKGNNVIATHIVKTHVSHDEEKRKKEKEKEKEKR
jgi:hypothetical protein